MGLLEDLIFVEVLFEQVSLVELKCSDLSSCSPSKVGMAGYAVDVFECSTPTL